MTPDCDETYESHWDAMRKFAKCLRQYPIIQDPYMLKSFSPYVNTNKTCEQFESSTNLTVTSQLLGASVIMIEPLEQEEEPPFHDDVPGMPWYWYWRDKAFSRTHYQKIGQKYWVDMGVLDYPDELCFERGMNCTATCCRQTYCAPQMGECINYVRKDFWELYTCVIVVLMIVVGIPTCIKTMEVLLGYKFCSKYDPDENCQVGGSTVCECFTNCCSKKKEQALGVEELEMDLDEHIEDLYDEQTKVYKDPTAMSQALQAYDRRNPRNEPSKCKLCCMAVFCCRTKNTLNSEAEIEAIIMSNKLGNGKEGKTLETGADEGAPNNKD